MAAAAQATPMKELIFIIRVLHTLSGLPESGRGWAIYQHTS